MARCCGPLVLSSLHTLTLLEHWKVTHTMQHTAHPMWETQVALERGMTAEGRERVRDQVSAAVEDNQRTRLKPYQDLIQAWLPKVADSLRVWVRAAQRGAGASVPAALAPLAECDPYVVSLLALRAVLDGLGSKHLEITNLSIRIGGAVEHEMQVRMWEKQEPKLFHATQNRLKLQGATSVHVRRVNISAFNDLLNKGTFGQGWRAWDQDLKLRVGSTLLNAIITGTGWFETGEAEEGTGGKSPPKVLYLKEGLEAWLLDHLTKLEELSPSLKPTVIPPKRWTGIYDGGYWTPYVAKRPLIDMRRSQTDQRANALSEYDAAEMPKVYEALHFLQETPWRINKRVHDVMLKAIGHPAWSVEEGEGTSPHWSGRSLMVGNVRSHTFPTLPDYQGREAPVQPADIETNEQARKDWRRAASEVKAYNNKRAGACLSFNGLMGIAHEYRAFDRFYFPHMLDFRGRMYPMPVGLQPQGNDHARSLLEFAEGKEVTEDNGGAAWLAINLASTFGKDKVSFDERIAWVEQHNGMWRRIAADPTGTADLWTTADKPWQALAAIYEWVGLLEAGWGYVSHAAVAVDGTCNGLQHLSALGRDLAVGQRVNLVPGEKPEDVYQYVADCLIPTLLRIQEQRGEPGEHASYWLGFAENGKLPRSLLKRPVMILAYSATRESFFNYTKEWLDEHDPAKDPHPRGTEESTAYWKQRYSRLSFLVGHMWDAVHVALPQAMTVMKWLQDCACKAAIGNQPIFWKTPDGFIVRHFYGKLRSYQVRVKLDGTDFQLRLLEPTKDLDKQAQLRGIAPNFVHSFDGAAARSCIVKAAEGGEITAFASIHDSFATHAADMWTLYGHLREAFVEIHETEVLKGFRNACLRVMVDYLVAQGEDMHDAIAKADHDLPPLPEPGELDIRKVLDSDYFFA